METRPIDTGRASETPLETSLVEWKPPTRGADTVPARSLETSLVEWKLSFTPLQTDFFSGLGNFLSGMETCRALLELADELCLGNFLSGMETQFAQLHWAVQSVLGNFLSGMETFFPYPQEGR